MNAPLFRMFSLTSAAVLILGCLGGCASDEPRNDDPVEGPAFDVDVDDGVETETDEGRNVGFDDDEPSGNQTEINDS